MFYLVLVIVAAYIISFVISKQKLFKLSKTIMDKESLDVYKRQLYDKYESFFRGTGEMLQFNYKQKEYHVIITDVMAFRCV